MWTLRTPQDDSDPALLKYVKEMKTLTKFTGTLTASDFCLVLNSLLLSINYSIFPLHSLSDGFPGAFYCPRFLHGQTETRESYSLSPVVHSCWNWSNRSDMQLPTASDTAQLPTDLCLLH